jgi:hypothetical protein
MLTDPDMRADVQNAGVFVKLQVIQVIITLDLTQDDPLYPVRFCEG